MQTNLIERMKASAKIAVETLSMIEKHVKPGVTTNYLNEICHEFMIEHEAQPAPLGYHGFPKSICTSINYVVCHGIPNDKPLKDGDILNIDVSLSKNGAFADTCKMFNVGKVSIMAQRLVKAAQESAYAGIAQVAPGVSLRKIGQAIEARARLYGYSIVREFCGHGIGEKLHLPPNVLNYDDPKSESFILEPGMTFTVEPMINVGKSQVKTMKDGWTVVTRDHSLSAQFEHTLHVTDTGVEILTLRHEEDLNEILKFNDGAILHHL